MFFRRFGCESVQSGYPTASLNIPSVDLYVKPRAGLQPRDTEVRRA